MSLKMECYSKWIVAQNGVSLKMEFHTKWSHSKRNVTKNEMSLKLECYSNSNVKCLRFQDWVNFTLIPCLPSGSLNTIEKKCLVAFPTIFYANAVRQGFVFIEKLQNNDLTITSLAALRRPKDDIWRFQGWPVCFLACFIRKNIWLLNIKCPWMIHCTNLKRFPQYLKCPRVNLSITSDENSPQVSPNGGVKATLRKCSKGSSFFLGMTSLSRPKVCYQRNGATPLNFFLN